jgi:hypothetical protein
MKYLLPPAMAIAGFHIVALGISCVRVIGNNLDKIDFGFSMTMTCLVIAAISSITVGTMLVYQSVCKIEQLFSHKKNESQNTKQNN